MARIDSFKHQSSKCPVFYQAIEQWNLLLVKHGPIDKKTGRSHLTAYLSEDDGKSWVGGLLLMSVVASLTRMVSKPRMA